MSRHIEAAVSAAIGPDHVANIACYNVTEDGKPSVWVEVIYRNLTKGPEAGLLQTIMSNVGDATCAADPRAVVSFIDEADMVAIAAE